MAPKIKTIIKFVLYPAIVLRRRVIAYLHSPRREIGRLFAYDKTLFLRHSGAIGDDTREKCLAKIILSYHVIEKGLTMPHRRLDFGHSAVQSLIELIEKFEKKFGVGDLQVDYAIGVILEYKRLHDELGCELSDEHFRTRISEFCREKNKYSLSRQLSFTRDQFFADVDAPFPLFAQSRHTCRHFEGTVDEETIRKAVALAMTTPSACNRQHWRVHSISDHAVRDAIYDIQKGKGNRGFGEDADKLLVITSDLQDIQWIEERNDVFVNGGMFLMNLCYALQYYKVANCILNWSVPVDGDVAIHKRVGIPDSERIVAMIACGNAPTSFTVAVSKRKDVNSILTFH